MSILVDEASYRVALHRLEELWNCAPGSPEADEMEALAIQVELYESQHHPVPSPTSAEATRFACDQSLKRVTTPKDMSLREWSQRVADEIKAAFADEPPKGEGKL